MPAIKVVLPFLRATTSKTSLNLRKPVAAIFEAVRGL